MIKRLIKFRVVNFLIDIYFIFFTFKIIWRDLIPEIILEGLVFLILVKLCFNKIRYNKISSFESKFFFFITPTYLILSFINYQSLNLTVVKDLGLFLSFILICDKKSQHDYLLQVIMWIYRILPICIIILIVEYFNTQESSGIFRDIANRNYPLFNYSYLLILLYPIGQRNILDKYTGLVYITIFGLLCLKTLTITGFALCLLVIFGQFYKYNRLITGVVTLGITIFFYNKITNTLPDIISRLSGEDFKYFQNPRLYESILYFKEIDFLTFLLGKGIGSIIPNPFYGILPNIITKNIDMIHIGYSHLIMKGGFLMLVSFLIVQLKVLNRNSKGHIILFLALLNILLISHQRFNLSVLHLVIVLIFTTYKHFNERIYN